MQCKGGDVRGNLSKDSKLWDKKGGDAVRNREIYTVCEKTEKEGGPRYEG